MRSAVELHSAMKIPEYPASIPITVIPGGSTRQGTPGRVYTRLSNQGAALLFVVRLGDLVWRPFVEHVHILLGGGS